MNLDLDTRLALGYKSPSQRARRLTEGWFKENMFCPACPSMRLQQAPNNRPVVDFICQSCGAEFQVKAKQASFGKKIRDAAYGPMMERVLTGRSPHFAFLEYRSLDWQVRSLLLVPGHFFTPNVVERCKPLSSSARRAGWVGCNILTDVIPPDGRLYVIKDRTVISAEEVRSNWKRFKWLADKPVESRGWTVEVLKCIRAIGSQEFALGDVYTFEGELSAAYPRNKNVRPKIRQQLQILRDQGIIRFLGRGKYVVL